MNKYPIGPNLKLKFLFESINDDEDFGYLSFQLYIPEIVEKFEECKEEMNIQGRETVIEEQISINLYNENIYFLGSNVMLDFGSNLVCSYVLNLQNFVAMSKKRVRIFKSLLLWENGKPHALKIIKMMLKEKASLEKMSKIFLKINTIYEKATEEWTSNKKQQNQLVYQNANKQRTYTVNEVSSGDMKSLNDRVSTLFQTDHSSSRISTGEHIVFQNEISNLFQSHIDELALFKSDTEYFYIKSVILEYIRWLKEHKLSTSPKLMQILWKLMWRHRDFTGIQNLI